jgi:hypothetical protein
MKPRISVMESRFQGKEVLRHQVFKVERFPGYEISNNQAFGVSRNPGLSFEVL